VYTSGLLHPTREEGVNFYQRIVREDIDSHNFLEEHVGTRIYPARGKIFLPGGGHDALCKEQAICASLEEGGKFSW
jgi:hypothetical protein